MLLLSLRHGGKAFLQVGNNIVDMLCSDGQADGIGLNALVQQFLRGKLGVSGSGRMNNQGFYIRHIGQQGKYFQIVNKLVSFCLSALNLESEDGCAAVRKIFFIQGMIRVIGQRGMVDLFHLRMRSQEIYYLFGVLRMTLQPQGEGFHTLQQQKGVKGRNCGSGVPQKDGADIGGKGGGTGGLRPHLQSLLRGSWGWVRRWERIFRTPSNQICRCL